VRDVVQAARDHGCSMRIGVNAGSLERDLLEQYGEPCPDAMVESALRHARILQDHDFHEFKISVKASDPFMTVAGLPAAGRAHRLPAAPGRDRGRRHADRTVKSSIGIGSLLWAGIGDTIRVSLAADPVEEVKVGFDILKSLGLRHRGVNIIACPSCARQGFNVIATVEQLEQRLAHISQPISLSIIGCVVNGPGEGADDRPRLHRRRQGRRHGLCGRQAGPQAGQRRHGRPHRGAGGSQGRGDRGRRSRGPGGGVTSPKK
jgi:(E)-4-hydroxy-3-methylbut-2-enyl-diphosphate synthase